MGPPSPTLRMVSTGRGGPAAASAPGHTPHSPRSPRGSSHSALWQDQGVHDGLHGKLVSDEEQRSQKQLCALSRTGWALLRRGAGWAETSVDAPSPSWSSWNAGVPRCWSSVPAASRLAGGDTGIASRRGRGGLPCSSRQVGLGPWDVARSRPTEALSADPTFL